MESRCWPRRATRLLKVVVLGGCCMALLTNCQQRERRELDLSDRIDDAELHQIESARDSDVLRFGFDLRSSPQEDARQYVPFLKYLGKATGYRFRLRFTPKDGKIVDDVGTGVVQFAAVGCGTYIKAREQYGVIPLVRGLNARGKAEYQSVIIAAPDSPIQRIEDLRGKRFAFGSITSTQGYLIPRIVLAQRGLTLEDLASCKWTGSHRNCANAVASGRFDAGGMQDTMGRELERAGIIRIIHTSRFYPSSGVVANRDVPAKVLAKVKKALLGFQPKGKDAEGLYHWEKTEMPRGFAEAHDEDYAELREWARRFGLLGKAAKQEAP